MNYTRLRNEVNAVTRGAQKIRQMEVAGKHKESPKVFWNYVKRKTVRVEKMRIPELVIYDCDDSKGMAESDKQKEDVLSRFYNSIFTKEISNELPYLIPWTLDRISTIKINKELVHNKL